MRLTTQVVTSQKTSTGGSLTNAGSHSAYRRTYAGCSSGNRATYTGRSSCSGTTHSGNSYLGCFAPARSNAC